MTGHVRSAAGFPTARHCVGSPPLGRLAGAPARDIRRRRKRDTVRLGYFSMPMHPLGRTWAETLREDRDAVLLADSLGFHDAFIGEHLTDRHENITNSLVFLATLISETEQIRLGTGTTNLSQQHPVLVAANSAMFDHLSGGRFILGVSPGALTSDAEALGILDEDRNKMFADAIDVITAIWEGEPPYDIRSARQPVRGQHRPHHRRGPRSGLPAQAAADAPPRDRRHRRGALLQGRHRHGAEGLPPALGELPAAAVGRLPLAQLRRGQGSRGSGRRRGGLARRPHRLRLRRRRRRRALRPGGRRTAPTASTTPRCSRR